MSFGDAIIMDARSVFKHKSKTYETLEREAILVSNGYKIISNWECDFVSDKEKMELEDKNKLEAPGERV